MSVTEFDELLCLVSPFITKENVIRDAISEAARLAMALRYLATGDCFTSISYQYLVGFTTASNIINET
ncbi:GSCOCG00010712001-RA-CDS [Cotesia congregata]|nr:GSCOCG00010712001-RA-CDS [Cotesia congregata]